MRLKPGVEWRRVEGAQEVVVLDLDTGSYLAIGGSGVDLWPRVVQGTTRAELVEALVAGFGIAPARARADVAVFLDQLRERALVDDDDGATRAP